MTNLKKSYFYIIIAFLIIISAVISIVIFVSLFNEINQLNEAMARDVISRRLEHSFSAINDFPGSAGKDILFLHNLSSVQNLHNTTSKIISPEVYSDFKHILNNNGAYKDLFFYRKEFNCVMRVSENEKYNNKSCEIPPPFIADILTKAAPLTMGQVYISPIISYRDISLDNNDSPVIAYVTPANTDCSIISIIDANYFLEEVRRLSREGESVFLLDKDGSYFANTDRTKEKFSGGVNNFYRDFSEVPAGTLADFNVRWLETKTKNFAFWRIYPTESNFAIYEGTNTILGENHTDDYFWTMAAVSDRSRVNEWRNNSTQFIAILIILVAHLLIAGFSFTLKKTYEYN